MARGSIDVDASIERRRVVPKARFSSALDDYAFPVGLFAGGGSAFLVKPKLASMLFAFYPGAVFLFLFFVVFPFYWAYASYRSYRLVRWDVLGSQQELRERVLDAVAQLDWSAMEDRKSVVVAYNRAGFTAGQVITIILRPNALYVNSRNRSGPKGRSPFSFGRDSKNIGMLRAALASEGSVVQPLEP